IELERRVRELNNTIAIQGPGASSLTVERAAGVSFTSAIFTVDPGQTASLSGLTVANGNEGGIFNNGGTLTVANCAVVNNTALSNGGIFGEGAGIDSFRALTGSGGTVSGHTASLGGRIFAVGSVTTPLSCTVSGSTVSGNSAIGFAELGFPHPGNGGGILTLQATISDSTISGNSTNGFGGGLDTSGATISDCKL